MPNDPTVTETITKLIERHTELLVLGTKEAFDEIFSEIIDPDVVFMPSGSKAAEPEQTVWIEGAAAVRGAYEQLARDWDYKMTTTVQEVNTYGTAWQREAWALSIYDEEIEPAEGNPDPEAYAQKIDGCECWAFREIAPNQWRAFRIIFSLFARPL